MASARRCPTSRWVVLCLLLAALCAGRQAAGAQGNPEEAIHPNFTGTVYTFDGKTLTLEQEDSNQLDFRCSRKTKYLDGNRKIRASAIRPGMLVTVEGKQAPDASLDAVSVRVRHVETHPGN